jgi:hypothetical protein
MKRRSTSPFLVDGGQGRNLKDQHYRIVICFAIAPPLPTPPSLDAEAVTPAFRSNTFQNFKLSSAAAQKVSLSR